MNADTVVDITSLYSIFSYVDPDSMIVDSLIDAMDVAENEEDHLQQLELQGYEFLLEVPKITPTQFQNDLDGIDINFYRG
jgi:hypothetical protein